MTGTFRLPRWARAGAFGGYVLVLVTATHWPTVDLGEAPPNSDKVLHIVAYALWGFLAVASGLFGRWSLPMTLGRVGIIGAVFAALDEATQALPGVNRHASAADWIADLLGLGLALGCSWGGSYWIARRRGSAG